MPPVVEVVDGVVSAAPVLGAAAVPPSVLVSCVVVALSVIAALPPPASVLLLSEELELSVEDAGVVELWDFVAVGGVARPVVGTVRGGAPAVLSDPALPPQAAITSAAAHAASIAADLRKR